VNRKRSSQAIIAILLAALLVLAGTAVARVAGTSKKSGKLTVAKIRKISAQQANRQIIRRAPRLSVASSRSADDSHSLGGAPASAYVQRAELAPVPAAILPLNPGWEAITIGDRGPPRGFRDQIGIVHLAGLMMGTSTTPLTLPPDLRPGKSLELPAVCDVPGSLFDSRPGIIIINSDGLVEARVTPEFDCTERLSLDGITFQAGG
jgi:hypothetical protein